MSEQKSEFTCYKCSHTNEYDPNDYLKKQIILEMKILRPNIPKTKEVMIKCNNCKTDNIVPITY